jgi:hypothetical protein
MVQLVLLRSFAVDGYYIFHILHPASINLTPILGAV